MPDVLVVRITVGGGTDNRVVPRLSAPADRLCVMITDLAVTAMMGACVLLAIAGATAWVARSVMAGSLPLGGKLALRPRNVARSPEALLDANRAAAPFMSHYALIVGVLALLVLLLALFSDVLAVIVHLVAIAMLCLGAWVCWTKAQRAAGTSSGDHATVAHGATRVGDVVDSADETQIP